MAKKPPPKVAVVPLPTIKSLTTWLGLFVALGAAAVVWDQFGWWHPASTEYVNSKVDPGLRTLKDIQIELAEGKRDQTQENIFKWRDRMEEEKDPGRQAIYRERVRELETVLSKQNGQIKVLNRIK